MDRKVTFLFIVYLFCVSSFLVPGDAQVTGHLSYSICCEDSNSAVDIKLATKTVSSRFVDINKATVTNLLKANSIDTIDILEVSNTGSRLEIFFAAKDVVSWDQADFGILTTHHAYYSYAKKNAFILPAFQLLRIDEAKAIDFVRKYPVNSFMFRQSPQNQFIFNVLGWGQVNGFLADMRNVPNSVRLVPYFKELNWKTIWYNENGVSKGISRPGTGW